MKIIFDLDGTLIDSSERMYRLFVKLVPAAHMSKDEYWSLKRNKINHKMILEQRFPEISFEEFNKKWLDTIEKEEYIAMDRNYADTLPVLDQLILKHDLYLLTARQSRENLLKELQKLGLAKYFKEILTTENKYSKEELFRIYCKKHNRFYQKGDLFISDMGSDIQLGNSLGYVTIAITHGFMNEENLKKYAPKYIIHELSEMLSMIFPKG